MRAAPVVLRPEPKPAVKSPAPPPAAEPGRPELSASPSALLLPEGPGLIQQALVKRGYLLAAEQTNALDAPTSAAVRRFQTDHQLARTGFPDRETVRSLGLKVESVFRSANRP